MPGTKSQHHPNDVLPLWTTLSGFKSLPLSSRVAAAVISWSPVPSALITRIMPSIRPPATNFLE